MPPLVTFALSEAAKEIFANPGDSMWAGEANEPIEFLVGRHALVRLDGTKHKRERKLMMPAVHGDRMVSYARQMRAIADDVIGGVRAGDEVDLQQAMQEITLRVILETVFGVPSGETQRKLHDALVEFLSSALTPTVTAASFLASGDRFRGFLTDKWAPAVSRIAALGGIAGKP